MRISVSVSSLPRQGCLWGGHAVLLGFLAQEANRSSKFSTTPHLPCLPTGDRRRLPR